MLNSNKKIKFILKTGDNEEIIIDVDSISEAQEKLFKITNKDLSLGDIELIIFMNEHDYPIYV